MHFGIVAWSLFVFFVLQLTQTIENLNQKLIEKGKEIVEFKEKNNIHFQVPEKIPEEDESKAESNPQKVGVLAT